MKHTYITPELSIKQAEAVALNGSNDINVNVGGNAFDANNQ